MSHARAVLLALACLAGLCAFMAFAKAQEPAPALPPGCGPLAGFLKHLQSKFNEFRIIELQGKGMKFVVTRSNEGAWTVLKVEGADAACVIADGNSSEVDRGF